jgi:hypothetical protein
MSQSPLDRLLGNDDPDPGCDAGLEVIDLYCEAVRRGEDAAGRFPAFAAHIQNCTACREDTEALLAALDGM